MDGPIPRVNGRALGVYLGRTVNIIVGSALVAEDAHHNPVVRTTDGIDVTVTLPPNERLEGAYVQIEGKVVKANPPVINAQRLTLVTGNFDAATYNQAIELAGSKYSYLFTA